MTHCRTAPIRLTFAMKSAVLAIFLAAPLMANADVYYVASVIGGRFETVVQSMESESSPIDKSVRIYNDDANNIFDKQAIRSMIDELARTEPKAEVNVLTINNRSILPANADYDDAASVKRFVQALSKGLSIEPNAKLLVMVPWKSDVLMRYGADERTGKRVDGFGFYIDRQAQVDSLDSAPGLEAQRGLLAVFANVRMVMIDLNEGTVLATKSFRDAAIFSASRSPTIEIIDSATTEEKAHSLITLLQHSVKEMLPEVIKRHGSVSARVVAE